MQLKDDTVQQQRDLSAVCRGEGGNVLQGMPEERALVYRGLIRNGIESALRKAYPLMHADLKARPAPQAGKNLWDHLVDEFIRTATLRSPHLWQMPGDLVTFIQKEKLAQTFELPYLDDLAAFEWLEIEVHMMADVPIPPCSRTGNHLTDPLVINPEHKLLALHYPVFRVTPQDLSAHAGQYFLLLHRDLETRKVHFIELKAEAVLLFEFLKQRPQTAKQLSLRLLEELRRSTQVSEETARFLMEFSRDFVVSLWQERVIIGFDSSS